jgi:hypothetical protein
MPDNTLLGRCCVAYTEAFDATTRHYTMRSRDGTRATIEHLAAELTIAGHRDAAGWLMGQLTAEVIELRPRTPGGAA